VIFLNNPSISLKKWLTQPVRHKDIFWW